MEENANQEEQKPIEQNQHSIDDSIKKKKKHHHPIVVVARDWKEYLGECLLIVFSVALAIGITEYLTSLHEKNQTTEILHQLKDELISNKEDAQEQYNYHLRVFELIDSAKRNPGFARKFLDSGILHLNVIMPQGVLQHDLKDIAWQQAKENDIFSRIDYETYSLLVSIYSNQERFLNAEPSIERILISYDSRKQENIQVTLTLIRDALFGWIVQRTEPLIKKYEQAIKKLAAY